MFRFGSWNVLLILVLPILIQMHSELYLRFCQKSPKNDLILMFFAIHGLKPSFLKRVFRAIYGFDGVPEKCNSGSQSLSNIEKLEVDRRFDSSERGFMFLSVLDTYIFLFEPHRVLFFFQ